MHQRRITGLPSFAVCAIVKHKDVSFLVLKRKPKTFPAAQERCACPGFNLARGVNLRHSDVKFVCGPVELRTPTGPPTFNGSFRWPANCHACSYRSASAGGNPLHREKIRASTWGFPSYRPVKKGGAPLQQSTPPSCFSTLCQMFVIPRR